MDDDGDDLQRDLHPQVIGLVVVLWIAAGVLGVAVLQLSLDVFLDSQTPAAAALPAPSLTAARPVPGR